MRRRHAMLGSAVVALGILSLAGTASADSGYLPFYGYSDYFGRPTTYYSPEPDVQQSTRTVDGTLGFGMRTYSAGGPFWAYKPTHPVSYRASRKRHRAVLRSKG